MTLPRALRPDAIVKAVLAARPGLTLARLRYDDDSAVHFVAQRAGKQLCVPVYRADVGFWSDGMVIHKLLQEIPA
jgi:hypothetical protein